MAVCLLLVLLPMPAGAQTPPRRVRLLVMDGIHFEHMRGYDNLERLLAQGAVALLNVNTGGNRSPESSAVSIGAGSRALGTGAGLVLEGLEEGEEGLAWQIFQRRAGFIPLPGFLVLPEIRALTDANAQLPYRVEPGFLASRLREGGFKAGALANADTTQPFRPAAAIAADGLGTVELGQTGRQLLSQDSTWPFGVRANLAAFRDALAVNRDVHFLVIDLGDSHRVQAYADLALPGQREVFRSQALEALDELAGLLLAEHRPGDLLILAGLQGDRILAGQARHLTPLVVYGMGSGFLTSPTTRREGLVANLDVTATILQHFGLYQAGTIYGQPLAVVEAQGDLAAILVDDELRMAEVFRLRSPYVRGYIGGIIVAVFFALAALYFNWRRLTWLKLLVLGLLATPLILLLLGALPRRVLLLPVWLVLAVLAALGLYRLSASLAMTGLGAATALAVAGDALLFNAWLQKRSILGYDAIAGARYYGIGNEYMGVLIGSTLLAISPLLAKKSWWALPVGGAVILLFMLPGVGANFGGTLAAGAGFAAAAVDWRDLLDKKYRRWAVLMGIGLAAGLVLFNILGNQSHVGRFFQDVGQNPGEILVVAQRKLAMNWKLVRWSLWSRAFAALFVAAVWFICLKRHLVAKYLGENWRAVRGAFVAAVTALLVNDSGVVAAATTLLYLSFPLIYLQLSVNSSVRASHSV